MDKFIGAVALGLIYSAFCAWAGYRYGVHIATAAADAKALAKSAGAAVDAAAAALKKG